MQSTSQGVKEHKVNWAQSKVVRERTEPCTYRVTAAKRRNELPDAFGQRALIFDGIHGHEHVIIVIIMILISFWLRLFFCAEIVRVAVVLGVEFVRKKTKISAPQAVDDRDEDRKLVEVVVVGARVHRNAHSSSNFCVKGARIRRWTGLVRNGRTKEGRVMRNKKRNERNCFDSIQSSKEDGISLVIGPKVHRKFENQGKKEEERTL